MKKMNKKDYKNYLVGLYNIEEYLRNKNNLNFKAFYISKISFMFSMFYGLFKEDLKTLNLTELISGNKPKINQVDNKKGENEFVALARHLRNSVAHGNFSIEGTTMSFEDFSAKTKTFCWSINIRDINALMLSLLKAGHNER